MKGSPITLFLREQIQGLGVTCVDEYGYIGDVALNINTLRMCASNANQVPEVPYCRTRFGIRPSYSELRKFGMVQHAIQKMR